MKEQWEQLLNLYDTPDSAHPGVTQRGYDRDRAARTTAIALLVAEHLGYSGETMRDFEATCLSATALRMYLSGVALAPPGEQQHDRDGEGHAAEE